MGMVILGFGRSAICVITEAHRLFRSCNALPAITRLDRKSTFIIDNTADAFSFLIGDELITEAFESADYVMIVVDPNDVDAVRGAAKAGEAARHSRSSFTVALCSEPIADHCLDATVQSAELRSLRATVDSLIVANTGPPGDNHARVARVAYTLVTATLGHRVNLIGLDLGDLKEALRGCAVAAVTRTDFSDTTGETSRFEGRIDLTPALAGNPRGLFCSFGASPDRLRLEDFESVGSVIHEALQLAYPMNDVTIVPACLADGSLDRFSEVVTCLAFDG